MRRNKRWNKNHRNNNRSIQTEVQLLSNYLNGEMLVASKFYCNCFVIIICWRWSWSFSVAVLKVVGTFFFHCVALWLWHSAFFLDVKRPTLYISLSRSSHRFMPIHYFFHAQKNIFFCEKKYEVKFSTNFCNCSVSVTSVNARKICESTQCALMQSTTIFKNENETVRQR